MPQWKLAGINFDHFHMGDNLRMAHEHPAVEIVGVADQQPERMQPSIESLGIAPDRVFRDYQACL
ncbi:MAG: gfo/Idh/MocA family oxidoreductase, partial [Pirellulales bacterium]